MPSSDHSTRASHSTTTKTAVTEHLKVCDDCKKNSNMNSLNIIRKCNTEYETRCHCTNQQLPQCGGVVPDPVWVGSKWLLAFSRVLATLVNPLHFFTMLPPERLQKGSTQLLQNRLPVFSFSFLLPLFVSSFFSFS